MKNKKAVVDVSPVGVYELKKYILHRSMKKIDNIMREVDTYFLHVLTGQRCESAWSCLTGWSEPDEKSAEKWETLCERIEEYENIEQDMCDEKTIGV